ncbi:inhibitor of nuclear factor kappa-B kinase subunit epsilon isoform X3 [Rhea pennata]|uniref:inhibitor of nuclear factor kappa-B kinase subunit epsilon isoform X3 n=1 Tax=Rhea pennata TaxID=8795 RepID=UPI002E25B861
MIRKHPDMYERAVLRKPQQKAYGVTVDLWSIGVTFYHAATGSLPFIPFGGPRRNKEIMYKITTEKPPGAIAGVQRQENGTIEWSYELPATCRLSVGLKVQLIPILANILEADQEKCWGFDQFFAETSDILHRIVVDVFSLQQASLHRIYIHSHNTTSKFLDAVFKQTNIAPHHQEYFFEGHLFELDPNLQAHNFCKTTEDNPLTLLSAEPEDLVGVRYRDREYPQLCDASGAPCPGRQLSLRPAAAVREICLSYPPNPELPSFPGARGAQHGRGWGAHAGSGGRRLGSPRSRQEMSCGSVGDHPPRSGPLLPRSTSAVGLFAAALEFPKFAPKVDVVADCGTAKSAVGAAHQTLWIARSLLRCQELTRRGLHWVAGNLKTECSRLLEQRRGAVSLLTCLQLAEVKTRALYETVPGDGGTPALKELSGAKARLQAVAEDLSQCSHDIFDCQGTLDGVLAELLERRRQAHADRSVRQIECCLEKMQLIHKQFKKARTCPRLGYNEEQIHKLDKVNLGHLARKVLLIFQDDCVQKYQEVLALHGSRMRKAGEIKKHLKRLSNCISACSVAMTECQDCLQRALDKFLQTVLVEERHPAPVPLPAHLNQARHDMAFRMQELLEQMKLVTCDLQLNNSIIERLSGAAPAPGI